MKKQYPIGTFHLNKVVGHKPLGYVNGRAYYGVE